MVPGDGPGDYDAISTRIKAEVIKRGGNYAAIGVPAGIAGLASYIKNDVRISSYRIRRLAEVLEVTPEWLEYGLVPSNPEKLAEFLTEFKTAEASLCFSNGPMKNVVLYKDGTPVAVGTATNAEKAVRQMEHAAKKWLHEEPAVHTKPLPEIASDGSYTEVFDVE